MDSVFRIFFGMASWLKQVSYIYVGVFLCTFVLGFFSWFLGTLVQMKRLGSYCYSTHTHKLHTKSLQMCASFKILNFQWGFSVCLGLCGGFLTGFCSDQGPIPTGGELGDYFCGFYLHACLSTWLQLRSVDANPLSGVYVQCWLQLTRAGREIQAVFISWKGEGAVLHQLTTNKQDRVPAVWAE